MSQLSQVRQEAQLGGCGRSTVRKAGQGGASAQKWPLKPWEWVGVHGHSRSAGRRGARKPWALSEGGQGGRGEESQCWGFPGYRVGHSLCQSLEVDGGEP